MQKARSVKRVSLESEDVMCLSVYTHGRVCRVRFVQQEVLQSVKLKTLFSVTLVLPSYFVLSASFFFWSSQLLPVPEITQTGGCETGVSQ